MSDIHWTEDGEQRSASWHSESGAAPPSRVVVVDDTLTANAAYRMTKSGTVLLWRGDHHNARQLLKALDRRLAKDSARRDDGSDFATHRAARTRRAEVLGRLVVELGSDHSLSLRRAPDVREACTAAYGEPRGRVVALQELLGVIGAHQWQTKGVPVPALGESVHPGYGVFSPVRGEYVDLVAQAPLDPLPETAFDLGTGTGVLAALLARRGVGRVIATDINPRAVRSARATMERLDLADRVDVLEAAPWPQGRADLVVCNPPWLPGAPTSDLEAGVYDPDSAMLRAFISGLTEHLNPGGEGWLIISDLAEHLGLRTRQDLLGWFEEAVLRVLDRHDTTPRHGRANDAKDSLHAARRAEVTSLWRLAPIG